MSFFVGDIDDTTVPNDASYDLTIEEKFEIFVDALAEEIGDEEELSLGELTAITQNRDDSTSCTQNTVEDHFSTSPKSVKVPTRRSKRLMKNDLSQRASKKLRKKEYFVEPPTRDDGLRPEVADLIYGGRKKKTKPKYKKYFCKYVEYCREKDISMTEEATSCIFFHDMIKSGYFGVGSMWMVFAAINSGMRRMYKINMNKWEELKKLLIALTKFYVPKKSYILTKDQLFRVLKECFDPNKPIDLLCLIVICLMIAGLLRQTELFMIEVGDVNLCEKTERVFIDFNHPTKSRAIGTNGFVSTSKRSHQRKTTQLPLEKPNFVRTLMSHQVSVCRTWDEIGFPIFYEGLRLFLAWNQNR